MASSPPSNNKFDIAAVIEHYTDRTVPDRGSGYVKVSCPTGDHEDRTPSATVNRSTGRVHCFSCQFSGDAIDLIQFKEGVDFLEAVKIAEAITGNVIQSRSDVQQPGGRKPPGRITDSGRKDGAVAGSRRPPRRILD